MSARGRVAAVLLLSLGAAGALTASGTRLAASEGTVLTALRTDARVPADEPFASFWDRIPSVEIPLSAQQVTPPKGGHRWSMEARAVHDGQTLYILVAWPDSSPDRSVGRPTDFTDAVAVQFPAVAAQRVPAFCMGDPEATVNIWQWKAAWQADVHRGFQDIVANRYPRAVSDWYPFRGDMVFYPGRYVGNPFSEVDRESAVDNLVAAGFGTLTPDPMATVTGWGAWRDGTWRVVFSRPLQVGREGNVEFGIPDRSDVAFAVWDGAAEERDGVKSVANFVTLDLSGTLMESGAGWPWWPAPFFAFLAVWALVSGWVAARTGRRRAP